MSIKTSKHSIKYSNKRKVNDLHRFIDEYRRVAGLIIEDIWSNDYKWGVIDKSTGEVISYEFSIKNNELYAPSFIDYKRFAIETELSARAMSSLVTQVSGLLKAATEKQRKRLYVLNKKKKEGSTRKERRLLARKIKTNIPQKPSTANLKPELSSKCCDWQFTEGEFDGFVRLKSILKDKTQIKIPVKYHRHSKKLASDRTQMTSFLFSKSSIDVRWKRTQSVKKRTEGATVGADQGYKDILTLSNKTKTPNQCPHGHSLQSIIDKMSTKKKGSKAFKRAQDHRKNFINWSINQLNLDQVKQVNLEQIWNIGYKSSTSRALSHWTNTLIRDKLVDRCDEHGVHVKHQSSTYRSQRCSSCGLVRKANRKGKTYTCKGCGIEIDSDLNAALNHEIDLPEIPYTLRGKGHNRGHGFYWQSSGITDLSGRSLESLPPVKD